MTDPSEQASAAPRRPTGDPARFRIPAEHVPEPLAERIRSGAPPVPPRPAATVVLVRDEPGGAEALLLRRPRRSRFAANAWVFPGGRVDEADADPALAARAAGPSAAEWAARLGMDDPALALAAVLAAVREAWEETGILLAAEPLDRAAGEAARRELLEGASFPGLAAHRGIRPATGALLYLAHWITPEPEPRRYDTRFFLARVRAGTPCELLGDELAEARWIRPADAVAAFERGTLHLLPPTLHTLRRLAQHATLDKLWRALCDAPVPAILPRMTLEGGEVVIEVEMRD